MLEDRYDGSSELVAELVTVNGFKAAFAIKDGAEGPRGWTVITIFLVFMFSFKDIFQYIIGGSHLDLCLVQNSGLPWLTPKPSLSLGSLTDAIAGAFGVCISISIYLLAPFSFA